MTDILTPLVSGSVVELGNRVWRKQVLPIGSIDYEGRRLDFSRSYLTDVAAAFRDGAFDSVPFVLADEHNRHTMDPERARGEVLGMEVADDGLYATVRLSDSAEQLVRDNPRLGVSVRVKENYSRPDGRSFRAACQHVLGTFDPKVTGMAPWAAVDLSNTTPATAVLDLSGLTYTTEKEAVMADDTDQTEDTNAQAPPGWFLRWLNAGAPVPAKVDATDGDTDGDTDGVQDADDAGQSADEEEELDDDAFVAALDGLFPTVVPNQLVTASNSGSGDVDLANAARDDRLAAVELSNRELQAKLDRAEYEKERAQLVRLSGLPPADIDLAQPLLQGRGRTVELANGDTVDPGEIVRALLARFGEKVRLLDLSAEIGPGLDLDDSEVAAERRQRQAVAFAAQIS